MYVLDRFSASSCPCSHGAVGRAAEVADLRTLVHSSASSAIVRWPHAIASTSSQQRPPPASGIASQLLWLRKFRNVRVSGPGAYPPCYTRASTLLHPCDIAATHLQRLPPSRRPPSTRGRNSTESRPAFWMTFAWHTQYAHWMLEHLPRLWYYLELRRHLPQPPVVVVPRNLASWQVALLRALPVAYGGHESLSTGTILPLSGAHTFSSLYVPGMLAHIGIFWTPQAYSIWEALRRHAGTSRLPPPLLPPLPAATATAGGVEGSANAKRLFSLREPGGRSVGGARVLADQPALAAGLRRLGFVGVHLDGLSVSEKRRALSRARTLVVECGSVFANAMFLPRGLRLIVLCMRDHTSSKGCYGQLLASTFTNAPVTTLRVGEPESTAERAATLTRPNEANNVQPHAAWIVSVPHTLQAIARLARAGEASRQSFLPVLPGCDDGTAGQRSATRSYTPHARAAQASASAASDWWREPLEAFAYGSSTIERSRVFSLTPCGQRTGSAHAPPRCMELARGRRKPAASTTAASALEWRPCALDVHCTRWRWCVRERANRSGVRDRYVDCEQPAGENTPRST